MTEEQCCKRSLLGSLWDSAKRAVVDPIPISVEDQLKRLQVCKGCDKFNGTTCEECGCVMHIKVKFAEMECPIGKWGKHVRE